MGRTHQAYAPEVRRQMVEPAKSGRTPSELARDHEASAGSISRLHWALGYQSPAAFKDLQAEAAA